MYKHPIGKLSRGAVLDVGLKCPHSCLFCYYSHLNGEDSQFHGIRHSSFRPTEECKTILKKLKQFGFLNFDITGGEPSVHPGIVEIVEYATELGLRSRMITLGQFLLEKNLLDDLLLTGLTNLLFSLHSPDERVFHDLTGAKLSTMLSAFDLLDQKGFQFCTNMVVNEFNYRDLPKLATLLTNHNVYHASFIYLNPHYGWQNVAWSSKLFGMLANHSSIRPYMVEAVEILEAHDIAVNLRYAPMCTVRGIEKNMVGVVGVRYDPYEWMNQGGHMGGDPDSCAKVNEIVEGDVEQGFKLELFAEQVTFGDMQVIGKRSNIRYFPFRCRDCGMIKVCDGIHGRYLERYGTTEFEPFLGEIEPNFPVHTARLNYSPPFIVKTEQFEDMKALLVTEFKNCALKSQ